MTVKYSYGIPSSGVTEESYLNDVLATAQENGLRYITDSDARAQGGAHYKAHLWDNGADAATELDKMLTLRKGAIANFSIDNIRTGEPYSVLEDVFVPLYFYHRYQTEAAVKMIGGLNYNYAVKGDTNVEVLQTLSPEKQNRALESVLETLSASHLAIPERVLALFPPRAHGYNRSRESFKSNNGVSFDALGAAATASDMTLSLLLHPQRANRLIQQKALNKNQKGLDGMLSSLVDATIYTKISDNYLREVQQTINYNVLKHLMNLAAHKNAIPQTKAIVQHQLKSIVSKLESKSNDAYASFMVDEITDFLKFPEKFEVLPSPKIPDGSPIGCFE